MELTQNRNVNYFLHLLSCAINGAEPEVWEGVDYSAILELAKKHQIYNIIASEIASLPNADSETKASFRNHNLSEITRMIAVNNERGLIFEELKAKKIKFMPLKGLIIKDYYPKESMRQMSDNDILFDESKRDDVAQIMKALGYKPTATGENSDDYFKPPYCTFEFHRTLFFDEREFSPKFDNLWNNAAPDDENESMYHMALDDVYIYNVCHMYKHYSTAGCGVRFLADNYLFLKKENDELNWGYINSQLEKYGISEYERKSRELAFKIFSEERLTEEQIALLETYINNGIYGKAGIRLSKTIEALADGGSVKNAKLKYYLLRLFPPKKKMIADYRVLEKHLYLLPFYYVYRLIKAIINSKSTIDEIKTVNGVNGDKDSGSK